MFAPQKLRFASIFWLTALRFGVFYRQLHTILSVLQKCTILKLCIFAVPPRTGWVD